MDVKAVVIAEDVCPQAAPSSAPVSPALEHVANQPIAHHVLDVLASVGIEDIVVVSSSESAAAIRTCLTSQSSAKRRSGAELRIRYVELPRPVELHHALARAALLLGGAPCVMHLGTGLLEQSLEPLIARLGLDAPDLVAAVHHSDDPVWHLGASTQAILHLAELHPGRATLSLAGVCVFGPGALDHASRVAWRSRGGSETDLTGVAAQIAGEGGKFQVLPVSGWCNYTGDPRDLLELNRIALDRMDHEMHRPTQNGNLVEGRVWIHEQASVRTSVIVGPVIVGPDAQISDAYVGPYTSIGAGARIEGAEIERSIVAAGASIMHVGSRLVASVVGRDARVFRDFSLPRAVRLRVGDGTEIALC
jgi:glucose-1-phosphate thymidylyltransferase